MAADGGWADFAKSTLPTLSGFSIAAYAIFFAILDDRAREALLAPEPSLENRSPLLILASAISHAVVVQLLGIMLALIFSSRPFPVYNDCIECGNNVNYVVSAIGLFLSVYGVVLILAAILSIFRILVIRSKTI
jgi:hypothetical protein